MRKVRKPVISSGGSRVGATINLPGYNPFEVLEELSQGVFVVRYKREGRGHFLFIECATGIVAADIDDKERITEALLKDLREACIPGAMPGTAREIRIKHNCQYNMQYHQGGTIGCVE